MFPSSPAASKSMRPKAADLLAAEGISAEVIDAFCVKPLDEDTIFGVGREDGLHRDR